MPERPIRNVLMEYTAEWMAMPGVVGTAIGQFAGRPCIKVFLTEITETLAAKFPETVEGHHVVLEEAGEFRAL